MLLSARATANMTPLFYEADITTAVDRDLVDIVLLLISESKLIDSSDDSDQIQIKQRWSGLFNRKIFIWHKSSSKPVQTIAVPSWNTAAGSCSGRSMTIMWS